MDNLGLRIKEVMQAKGYPWFADQNVVSIEGMEPDGTPNDNRSNAFDDIKMVLDGDGKIIGGPWRATTAPGKYWTENPMAEGGAFIISLGPQACWGPPGDYSGYTVWRQAENSTILGTRDPDATYQRIGPPIVHGNIGVHHHGGGDQAQNNIGMRAAGCQVIKSTHDQAEFMKLTMTCARYQANPIGYRLTATVMPAEWLAATTAVAAPISPPIIAATQNADFAYCLKLVLVHEGGNDDDPADPGGRTSRGIIQTEWNTWRQTHPGLPSDVWQAPQDQVEAIYKQKYWNVLFCDGLPSGIDYAVFDYGVNSGVSRSAKLLQTILGISADGIIGKNTIAAAGLADAKSFINSFCDERLAFLQGLSTWGTFGRGWTNRVTDVRRDALAMVDNPPAKPEVITVVNPPAVVTPPVVIIPPPGPAQGGLTPAQIAQIAAVVQQMVAGAASSPKTTVVIGDLLGQLASHFPTLAALGWIVYSVLNSIATYGATPDAATAAAPAVLGGSAIVGVLLKLNQVLRGQST